MVRAAPALMLAALVLGTPTVLAETASGELAFPQGATLQGPVEVSTREGALDVSGQVTEGGPLDLSWAAAEGWTVTRTRTYYGPPGTRVEPPEETRPQNASLTFPSGSLASLSCTGACIVLFLVTGEGAVTLTGRADGSVGWLAKEIAYFGGAPGPGAPDSFRYAAPPGWIQVSSGASADGLRLDAASAGARGDIVLFLWNATASFRTATGTTTIATGVEESPLSGAEGLGVRRTSRFAVLRLDAATLALPEGASVRLLAARPDATLAGTLLAPSAVGRFILDGREVLLQGESLRLDGTLLVQPVAPDPQGAIAPLDPRRLEARIEGDVEAAYVDLERMGGQTEAATTAATVGIVAVGLAILAATARLLGYFPFYTRLEPSALLRSPKRSRLYSTVQQRPGLSMAELMRETGFREIVVRHHLHILERHRLVVRRAVGKLRTYFVSDAGVDAEGAARLGVLKDPSRRRVASLLVESPGGLTQKDIMERTGFSQRVVSHHLTRLSRAALLEDDGEMPRRYAAAPALATTLKESERGQATAA